MSIDRRLLNWGIFLVLLGGVPLAVAQGWVDRDLAGRAWELWPFILIGAGIGLILSRTPLRALGGIVVAATSGIILGALVAVGFGAISLGGIGCGGADTGAPQIARESGAFGGGSGRVILDATCASVTVGAGTGTGWVVDVRGVEAARPTIAPVGDRLEVRSPSGAVVFPFTTRRSSWGVTLPTEGRLDVELRLNAGDLRVALPGATLGRLTVDGNAIGNSRLDLADTALDRLEVSVNAGDLAIRLPKATALAGSIHGNAASIQLCAAAGVGLRLLAEGNITASNNYEARGLVKTGDAWETPGYASAATRVELRTTGSAISYTLNPEDGCE
jgi:hypothetical protein